LCAPIRVRHNNAGKRSRITAEPILDHRQAKGTEAIGADDQLRDLRFQALNDMGENRPAGKRQQAFLTADLPPAKTMPTTGSRAFIPGL
jgi:hypothetical protein